MIGVQRPTQSFKIISVYIFTVFIFLIPAITKRFRRAVKSLDPGLVQCTTVVTKRNPRVRYGGNIFFKLKIVFYYIYFYWLCNVHVKYIHRWTLDGPSIFLIKA